MTESGERDRAREAAVEDYLNSSASAFDSFGQGFDKGWQAAFEAGRGQRYEELRNKAEELLMKARDMDMSGMDSGWVLYAANQMLIAATPAPPDSGDANKK